MQDEVVEVVGYLIHAQVFVKPRLLHDLPYLLSQHRKLLRVHPLRTRVLVHQLLTARDVAVAVGGRHRRHEMVDDDCVCPPLRLRALARIVDDERIEVRHVLQAYLRQARPRQPHALARRPLQRAMLAQMHHRISSEAVPQPPIERYVVMCRHKLRAVVYGNGILAEPAWRLYPYENIAEPQPCHEQMPVIHIYSSRRLTPVGYHGILHILGYPIELRLVLSSRNAPLGISHLFRRQEVGVVSAAVYQPPHQLVAVLRNVLDGVPGIAHRVQQVDCGRRRVQPYGISQTRCLCRIVAQHNRNLALRRRSMRHPSIPRRQPCNCLSLLDVRHIPPQFSTAH